MVLVFKNVEKRSMPKNCRSVNLLSAVSKVFEKFVNNWIIDPLEKLAFFLISNMVLGHLDQNADLLRVVSDRTGRVFNRSGAT